MEYVIGFLFGMLVMGQLALHDLKQDREMRNVLMDNIDRLQAKLKGGE